MKKHKAGTSVDISLHMRGIQARIEKQACVSFDLADWKMKFSNSFVTIGHILHDYLQILQNQTIIALIET